MTRVHPDLAMQLMLERLEQQGVDPDVIERFVTESIARNLSHVKISRGARLLGNDVDKTPACPTY